MNIFLVIFVVTIYLIRLILRIIQNMFNWIYRHTNIKHFTFLYFRPSCKNGFWKHIFQKNLSLNLHKQMSFQSRRSFMGFPTDQKCSMPLKNCKRKFPKWWCVNFSMQHSIVLHRNFIKNFILVYDSKIVDKITFSVS